MSILRERTLRAAEAGFGHRLMMDVIVPGGVSRDIAPRGLAEAAALVATVRSVFPKLVELYDNTASLQDRTVTTGIVKPKLAMQFGAGGFIGRASGRAFDARRALAYAPYNELSFEVPVLDAGDVNARVWLRIREVEQSLLLIRQILAAMPSGDIRVPIAATRSCEGVAVTEAFRGDVLVWLSSTAKGRLHAVICVTRLGFNGHCWRLQSKEISWLTFHSVTSRLTARIPDTTSRMRKSLFEGLIHGALTERPPALDEMALAELATKVERVARVKLGRSLSIRQVDAGSQWM